MSDTKRRVRRILGLLTAFAGIALAALSVIRAAQDLQPDPSPYGLAFLLMSMTAYLVAMPIPFRQPDYATGRGPRLTPDELLTRRWLGLIGLLLLMYLGALPVVLTELLEAPTPKMFVLTGGIGAVLLWSYGGDLFDFHRQYL